MKRRSGPRGFNGSVEVMDISVDMLMSSGCTAFRRGRGQPPPGFGGSSPNTFGRAWLHLFDCANSQESQAKLDGASSQIAEQEPTLLQFLRLGANDRAVLE